MIESRYTIEYVSPESKDNSKGRKPIALFIFIFFALVLSIAAYFYISSDAIYDFIKTPKTSSTDVTPPQSIKQTEQKKPEIPALPTTKTKKEVIVEKIIPKNNLQKKIAEKKVEVTEQISKNKTFNNALDNLTQQLMAERKKNKALDKQLNSQKSQNNQLSELLENALSKASDADKNYLDAISSLEKKTLNTAPKVSKKPETTKELASNIIVTEQKNTQAIITQENNSIRLSTSSQVDAIIAAMKNKTNIKLSNNVASTVIKADVDKSKEIQLVSVVNQANTTELLHIQLQRQINELLNNKNTSSIIQNTNYTKSLEKESITRENAVRSITIKKGETLWEIAKRAYGSGSFYKKIIKANPQIDINKLYIGQIIRVPN